MVEGPAANEDEGPGTKEDVEGAKSKEGGVGAGALEPRAKTRLMRNSK